MSEDILKDSWEPKAKPKKYKKRTPRKQVVFQ